MKQKLGILIHLIHLYPSGFSLITDIQMSSKKSDKNLESKKKT